MNPATEKYFRDIAKIYQCKLTLRDEIAFGGWLRDRIWLGTRGTLSEVASCFCHELAHYRNWLEGKYPAYHREIEVEVIERWGLGRYCHYALEAEIYTDRRGKELCREWFPGVRYEESYRRNNYWRGFVYGYYSSMLT